MRGIWGEGERMLSGNGKQTNKKTDSIFCALQFRAAASPFPQFCWCLYEIVWWGVQSCLQAAKAALASMEDFYNCLLNNCWEHGLATARLVHTVLKTVLFVCSVNVRVCVCVRVAVLALTFQLASAAGPAVSTDASHTHSQYFTHNFVKNTSFMNCQNAKTLYWEFEWKQAKQ